MGFHLNLPGGGDVWPCCLVVTKLEAAKVESTHQEMLVSMDDQPEQRGCKLCGLNCTDYCVFLGAGISRNSDSRAADGSLAPSRMS